MAHEVKDNLTIKVSRDAFFYSLGTVFPAALNFAALVIFTRMLAPEAFGEYQLAITAVLFISAVSSNWLQQSTFRYFQDFKNRQFLAEFNFVFLLLLFCISILATLALLAASLSFYKVSGGTIFILLAACIVYANLQALLQADLKARSYSQFEIIRCFLFLIVGIVLLYFHRSGSSLVLAATFTYVFLVIAIVLRIFTSGMLKSFSYSWLAIKKIFSYGFPFFFWFLGAQVLAVSDRFFIDYFRGSYEVGVYTSNYTLMASSLGLLSTPILLAAHTNIMKPWAAGEVLQVKSLISLSCGYYLMLSLPIFSVVLLYSKDVANIALGADFREGFFILPIIFASLLINGLAMFGQKNYELEEKTMYMAIFVVLAGCINFGLNIYFVRVYGYKGAAITTLLTYIIYLLFVSSGFGVGWRVNYPWRCIISLTFALPVVVLCLYLIKETYLFNSYLLMFASIPLSYIFLMLLLYSMREPLTLALFSKVLLLIPSNKK